MYIVVGGTGHVGSAIAKELLEKGLPVMVVARSKEHTLELEHLGAKIAVADVRKINEMHQIFNQGDIVFLLNPPASPSVDTDAEEKEQVRCLIEALQGSTVKKVVAESVYGAQKADNIGDLGVLYEMETALRTLPLSLSIIRAGYYMSNWDQYIQLANQTGQLKTMFPADLKIPMVAPEDIGSIAANLLMSPEAIDVTYVEGPEQYSVSDVADVFSKVLNRPVVLDIIPRGQWEEAYKSFGFSEKAAKSYTGMTSVTVDRLYKEPFEPVKGKTTLFDYISQKAHHLKAITV